MRHIACIIAYDGTDFAGSQRQKNGRSVQGELEGALEQVLKHPAPIALAGRTDAGVHATGQCGRFATTNRIPAERVPMALNRVLDKSIKVLSAWEVDAEFHPRFSAIGRVYRYTIHNAPIANPLLSRIVGQVRDKLDVAAMRDAARHFIGRHDFKAWQSAGSPAASTVRTVRRLEVRSRHNQFGYEQFGPEQFGSSLIEIEIEADAFLYQMVRNIVGALIAAGHHELNGEEILRLTAGRDRTQCPPPAPPQGLCLVQVKY
jgi:tRNA pseudouridine38-40 synthase